MGKWELVRLGDLADVQAGGTPKRGNSDYWKNGTIPWVKISDLTGNGVFETEEFITTIGLEESSTKIFPVGTILFTIFATLGEVDVLHIDAATNQAIAGINVLNAMDVDGRYLANYLKSIKHKTIELGRGVAQNNINLSILRDILIPLPPFKQQRQIADMFDRASALINKRKAQMDKLDLLVKSRFIEMFGDPVMNPQGWKEECLGDIAKVGSSKRVFVEELVDEGIPFYRGTEIGALATGQEITPSLFITKEHYNHLKAAMGVPGIGDLLMPSICPDGRIWRVDTLEPFYFKDGRVLWVRFTEATNFDDTYLLYALKQRIIADYVNIASGTTFAELKIFSLKKVRVLLPPISLQIRFAIFVQQIETQKLLLQRSLDKLEQHFKSLMQKCLRGEVS